MYRILFAASEAYPFIKTGGLADVAGSLPIALTKLGCDVRLLLPAYPTILRQHRVKKIQTLAIPALDTEVMLLEATLPHSKTKVWLIQHPWFDREGNPYHDEQGHAWHDSAQRFGLLSHCIAELACEHPTWRPDILHCNDWQTALVPALLSVKTERPRTVFTIHNLAYQGVFPPQTRYALNLPESLWTHHGLEFYGQLSFIKGGLAYADQLTTVSPTYAEEIQTPAFGNGLDGLLSHRRQALQGILNGIDDKIWNPSKDSLLWQTYNSQHIADKLINKRELQKACGLAEDAEIPLIGMISRMVEQKGFDLLLQALPHLMQLPLQLVILGSGQREIENTLKIFTEKFPQRLHLHLGYDETLAHRIEAGADIFLMPSRFEPCGLNQLYSLRYGTVPVVHRTGGLADTVIDVGPGNTPRKDASGFAFAPATGAALLASLSQAMRLYRNKTAWTRIVRTGMRQDHSWQHRAKEYMHLYERLVQDKDTA